MVSKTELEEEEVRCRISVLTGLESGSISMEVIVDPFFLEAPSGNVSSCFATSFQYQGYFPPPDILFWLAGVCGFCCLPVGAPFPGQELYLVMLGLLEPATPKAPRGGKASSKKRAKVAATFLEDENEGRLEVEAVDEGDGAAQPSG